MIFDAIMPALSGVANPEKWLVDWVHGGQETASGESINEDTALTIAAVYAAVKILSETVAQLPLEVFRRLPAGGREPAYDHPVYRLLHDEPNEEVSSFNWRETGQGHLCTYGNAYSEIQRTFLGGPPVALWGLSPARVTPKRGDDGRVVYEHRNERGVVDAMLPQRDVLHVPGFGFDGLVGYSPITLHKEQFGTAKAGERFGAEMFANHGAYSGVVTAPHPLSDQAYDRLRRAAKEQSSRGKRHSSLILEEGATWAATNMKASDLQAIEARRFSVEEVARVYRISLHLLQEFTEGAASYASIVELGREFIVYTMMPWLRRWQAEINRKLLDAEHFAEFNVAAFLQGDHAARAEFYVKGFSVGMFSVNEIREKENMNPIGPEGDRRFVPLNIQPLDRAVAEPQDRDQGPGDRGQGEDDRGDEPQPPPEMQRTLGEIRQDYQDNLRWHRQRGVQAAQQVIRDVMARFVHKEQNAARRAAGRPDRFVGWLDQFYAAHAEQMTQALHNPIAAWAAAEDQTGDVAALAERVAGEHCRRHQAALLSAAECRAAELPQRVAECVDQFTTEIPGVIQPCHS